MNRAKKIELAVFAACLAFCLVFSFAMHAAPTGPSWEEMDRNLEELERRFNELPEPIPPELTSAWNYVQVEAPDGEGGIFVPSQYAELWVIIYLTQEG